MNTLTSSGQRSEVLLDEALKVFTQGKIAYRDCAIQVGRILHEFILERLREGDELNEFTRRRRGLTRTSAVIDASKKLQVRRPRIQEFISIAMVVDLLSSWGQIGSISYTSLRHFRVTIERCVRGREPHSIRRSRPGYKNACDKLDPSMREQWRVISIAGVTNPKKIFEQAVDESWSSAQVWEALLPYSSRRSQKANPCVAIGSTLNQDIREAVKNGAPRDVALMILELIDEAENSLAIKKLLAESLSRSSY